MADRYWVGGSGIWDGRSTANWSTTSGGIPGASVPTSADNVFFDANSSTGSYTVTFGSTFSGTIASSTSSYVAQASAIYSGSLSPGDVLNLLNGSTPLTIQSVESAAAGRYTLTTTQSITSSVYLAGVPTCKDMTVAAPATGTVTFNIFGLGNSSANTFGMLNVYGSFTLPASGCFFSPTNAQGTFSLNFMTSSANRTITTNGTTLTLDRINFFDTSNNTTSLGGALTLASYTKIFLGNGNFSTANFNISAGYFICSGSSSRSLTLGTSVLTLVGADSSGIYPWDATTTTNLTFSGASSAININNSSSTNTPASFRGGGLSYGTVGLISGATSGTVVNFNIVGTNNFVNLTILGNQIPSTYDFVKVSVGANQTVSGTLTIGNSSGDIAKRVHVYSSTFGTARTISASTISLYSVDFLDITASGAAGTWTGSNLGNCGNNTNITFPVAKTVYMVSSASTVDGYTAIWATSSGGATSLTNFPLVQDTIIIDNNTRTGGGTTVVNNFGFYNIGTINGSSRSAASTITISTSATVNIFGSLILGTWFTYLATSVSFNGPAGSYSITSNGRTFPFTTVAISAAGTYTLTDTFNQTSAAITVNSGTFDTGNQTVTAASLIVSSGSTKVINLGSSTITLSAASPIAFTSTVGLTLNAGTSSIVSTSTNPGTTSFGSLTFYNVSFTGSQVTSGSITMSGSPTFNNLTISGRGSAGTNRLLLSGNITINGTFTVGVGTVPGTSRTLVYSSVYSVNTRTITAAAVSLTDADFCGIVAAGAAGTWTGTRLGNAGGNSNITFDSPKTVYYVGGLGNDVFSASNWSTSSGGSVSNLNFPLPQDTFIIDDNSLVAYATLGYNYPYFLGSLDASSRTNPITINSSITVFITKNLTLSSAVTITAGAGNLVMASIGQTVNITSAGVVFPISLNINNGAGITTLIDSFTTNGSAAVTLANGTLNLNGNSLTCVVLNLVSAYSKGLLNGNVYITGGASLPYTPVTVCSVSSTTGLTASGVNIYLTYSGSTGTRVVTPSTGTSGQNLNYFVTAGSDVVSINNSTTVNYLNTLDFNGFTGTLSGDGPVNKFISGNYRLSSGMTIAPQNGFSTSFTALSGTQTITTNGQVLDFPIVFNGLSSTTYQLQDSMTIGSTRTVTLTGGTLDLNNYNLSCGFFSSSNSNTRSIAFGTGKIYLSGNNGNVLGMTTITNFTYTGTPDFYLTYSGSTGSRVIQQSTDTSAGRFNYYVTAGSDTVQFYYGSIPVYVTYVNNVDFTGFSGTLYGSLYTYGNLTLSSTMSFASAAFYFLSTSGTKTITTNGVLITGPVAFNGVGGTWQFQDNMTVSSAYTVTLTNGTLDLNNYDLTCGFFSSSNSNLRTLAFGTGQIYLTGTGGTLYSTNTYTFLTITGVPIINVTYAGLGSTRVISSGSDSTGATAVSVNLFGSADVSFTSGTYYNNVDFTGFTGACNVMTINIYGNLTCSKDMTILSSSNPLTFVGTSGVQKITCAGTSWNFPVVFNGVGGTFQLQDNMTIGSTKTVTHTAGTIDLNGTILNVGASYTTSGSSAKNITFNGGQIICPTSGVSSFIIASNTNFSTTAGTANGIISMTSSSAKTFTGNGVNFAATLNQGGTGSLTVVGNNTFYDLTANAFPSTISLTAGSQQILGRMTLQGIDATNRVTLNSTSAGSSATVSAGVSALVTGNYLTLKDITATGGATWRAGTTSTVVSNVSGFDFTALASRLDTSGNHSILGYYDEVSTATANNRIDVLGNQVGILDEVTNNGSAASSLKYLSDKTVQIVGVFDEVTGIV